MAEIPTPALRPVDRPVAQGRVVGALSPEEDIDALVSALVSGRDEVLRGARELLIQPPAEAPASLATLREAKLRRLAAGELKRYAFAASTAAGLRVIKLSEPVSLGNALLGAAGSSVARREHSFHARAQGLGLAVTQTQGFLELRTGLRLVRACQIQTHLAANERALGPFLTAELERHGDAALEPLAAALAEQHRQGFFHADIKAFHAFVRGPTASPGEPTHYGLAWLDLGRASFHMTPRKRIINLYQMLRFVVPRRPQAEERFVLAYCRAADWFAAHPTWVLSSTRRFLAHKLRTHPNP